MTKQFDEQFSAFLDGELHESEHESVIQRICQDTECKRRWQSYHVISDALRNNLPNAIHADFSQTVMDAIEKEPTILAPSNLKKPLNPMTKRAAGVAMAASVAVVAILGVQSNQQSEQNSGSLAEMPSSKEFVRLVPPADIKAIPAQVATPTLNTAAQGIPVVQQNQEAQVTQINKFHPHLNKYLVDHNQHASDTRVQGIMPYARIVVSPSQSQQLSQVK